MKKIIIKEWLRFVNHAGIKDIQYQTAYIFGFWNVMQYNEQLEKFLIDNQIKFEVTEKSLL